MFYLLAKLNVIDFVRSVKFDFQSHVMKENEDVPMEATSDFEQC